MVLPYFPRRATRREVVLSRVAIWINMLGLLLFCASHIALCSSSPVQSRTYVPQALALLGGFGAALLLSAALSIHGRRWSRRALIDARSRICPGCCYVLTGLGETGLCPECGCPFTVDDLDRYWRTEYSIPRDAAR